MLSPYRINPNNTNKRTKTASNGNFYNNARHDSNVKRPQMTSIDLKRPQSISESLHEDEPVRSKNKLKGGANNEINEHYSDEFLQNDDPKMEIAMRIFSNDKTVRKDTIQDLKDFNSQSLATQFKKRRTIGFYDACYQKSFEFFR